MTAKQDLGSSLISLLANGSLGLPLIALVADVIAADARFNHWFAFEGKRTLSGDAVLRTLDVYEDVTMKCREGIAKFSSTGDGKLLDGMLEETLRTLKRAAST